MRITLPRKRLHIAILLLPQTPSLWRTSNNAIPPDMLNRHYNDDHPREEEPQTTNPRLQPLRIQTIPSLTLQTNKLPSHSAMPSLCSMLSTKGAAKQVSIGSIPRTLGNVSNNPVTHAELPDRNNRETIRTCQSLHLRNCAPPRIKLHQTWSENLREKCNRRCASRSSRLSGADAKLLIHSRAQVSYLRHHPCQNGRPTRARVHCAHPSTGGHSRGP